MILDIFLLQEKLRNHGYIFGYSVVDEYINKIVN